MSVWNLVKKSSLVLFDVSCAVDGLCSLFNYFYPAKEKRSDAYKKLYARTYRLAVAGFIGLLLIALIMIVCANIHSM